MRSLLSVTALLCCLDTIKALNITEFPMFLQAEDAKAVFPMELYNDSNAIGEKYVGSDPDVCSIKDPSGKNVPLQDEADSASIKGFVHFDYKLQEQRLVSIKARILAPDSLSDSFWCQLGSPDRNISRLKWFTPKAPSWKWVKFSPFSKTDKNIVQSCFTLDEGVNFFRLFVREPGAAVDMIEVTDPDPLSPVYVDDAIVAHEGCSGGCTDTSTARFTLDNLCGPDTLDSINIFVEGEPCTNIAMESNTVITCRPPPFKMQVAQVVIMQGSSNYTTTLVYQVPKDETSNKALIIGVSCAAGGLAVIAGIIIYFSTSRMRSYRKMYNTAAIAEDMAEKVARMELEQLEYLNDIENPTKTQKSFQTIVKALSYYKTYLPEALFTGWKNNEPEEYCSPSHVSMSPSLPAPGRDGTAAIVFTDIQGSTSIWETCPSAMRKALSIHNQVIRSCIRENNGYEVKTIGDAFMVAFERVEDAIAFALSVQEQLFLSPDWPSDLATCGLPHVESSSGWKGLRLRIGINCGEVDTEVDSFTGKSDYFGQTVNKAARIEHACVAGAVCIGEETLEEVRNQGMRSLGHPIEIPMGQTTLRGVQSQSALTLLIPQSVAERSNDIKRALTNKQFQKETAIFVAKRDASFKSDTNSKDASRKEVFEQIGSCTVGHLKVRFTEIMETVVDAYTVVNQMIATVLLSAERTEGSVISLHSNSVIVGWNTSYRCALHQQAAVRFSGLTHKAILNNECSLRAEVGLATGNALYGKVGTKNQKFVTVVGSCVEVAESTVNIAMELGAFALATSLPGHRSVAQDPSLREFVRPIERLPVPGRENELIYVYELHGSALKRGMFAGVENSEIDPKDWAWSAEYNETFKASDFEKIITATADMILLKVARRLEQQAFYDRLS